MGYDYLEKLNNELTNQSAINGELIALPKGKINAIAIGKK